MKEATVHPLSAFDAELAGRFQRAAHFQYAMNWAAVKRRAEELELSGQRSKRKSRRTLALAAALAVIVGAASPAVGLDRVVLDFLSADRAPETVQVDFGLFDRLDPARGPGTATSEARTVHTFRLASGTYELTVAPAATGFCWGISGFGLTCENAHSRPIDLLYRDIPEVGRSEPVLIASAVRGVDLTRITITFEDGDELDLPLVVVSDPIGASFFLYEVPETRWNLGSRPAHVTAYDSTGAKLGSGALMYTSSR
jgi:hypothetical protein